MSEEKQYFIQYWNEYIINNPQERKGQSLFNCVYRQYPEIADKYRGSDIDPFYNDSNINSFIDACFGEITKEVITDCSCGIKMSDSQNKNAISSDSAELIDTIKNISTEIVEEAIETKECFAKDNLIYNAIEVEGYIRGIYTLLKELESATGIKFRDYEEEK